MRDRAGFFRKKVFAQKTGKMGEKQGFLNLLKNFVFNVYRIRSIMKNYKLGSSANPTYGKMFSATQIAEFLNQKKYSGIRRIFLVDAKLILS